MIGRNKNWTGQSDWMRAFNEKHNKGIHEEEEKKKIKKKNLIKTLKILNLNYL